MLENNLLVRKSARLVIIKNPFQPWKDRTIKEINAGEKVCDIVQREYKNIGCDIYVSVNGKTIPINDYEILGGEIITLSPIVGKSGAKNIIGLVAMIGLAVATQGIMSGGLHAWGTSFATMNAAGTAVASVGWASYALAAATMLIGGALISKIMTQQPKVSESGEQSYGWNGPSTMEGQNNPIQMTYGRVLSGGQTIAKYVNISDNKEYLNWLIACGEGELTFSDIVINDNPYDYYDGVEVETRPGTNDQEIIEYFNDTYATKGLGYELLDDGERTDTADGNATQGLIVKLEFSQGLYHYTSKGKTEKAWVSIRCEYRVTGTSTWVTFFDEKIEGSQTSALRKEIRVDNLEANKYEVRVKVTGRSAKTTSTKDAVRCWWVGLTTIVYDDFAYPNTALIGVRALATDQINGSPTIKFIKERANIWAYNPHTKQYEQKPANNPAWACYDMLHLGSRLYNINTNKYEFEARGVPADSMLYDQFDEWAAFCEEKKFYINIEIVNLGEMLNVINENIASIGHGMVIRYGTKYGCVWYCVKQPVQMFGMGNIISGTFKEDFLSTNDRANCIELTYINAEHDYNKETITLYSEDYDNQIENATQVTFNGITSYEQAYREGMYQLYCNKYLLRTVSFEANIDAISCTVGDVILVAHDVPMWADSGRIYDVDVVNNALVLPVEIGDISGQYRIMYRTEDDVLHVNNIIDMQQSNGYTTVYLETALSGANIPSKNDVFDVAQMDIGSKPFVVSSITRSQDFTRRIDCIEYNESLYNEDYELPPVRYEKKNNSIAQDVTGLDVSATAYVNDNGNKTTRLNISWQLAVNGGRYTVLISTDNEKWRVLQSDLSSDFLETDVEYGQEYYIKVVTILGLSKSKGVVYGPIDSGQDELPPDVTHIDVEVLKDGTRRYYWDFEYPVPNDIAGFRMKYIQGNHANWGAGYEIQQGLITSQPYETTTVRQGTHCIMIKAVDNAGQESENFASCIIDFGDPIVENVLMETVIIGGGNTNTSLFETDGIVYADGSVHARNVATFYETVDHNHWVSQKHKYWEAGYQGFYLTNTTKALASGYFWLRYDIEGIYNLSYKIKNKDNIYKQYSTKILVEAGDEIEIRFESQETDVETVITRLETVIDVPDAQEHFENIMLSENGTILPLTTPNYYTTAIKVDDIITSLKGTYELEIMSKQPCKIRFNRINNDASFSKTPTTVVADITWQGFSKEVKN